MSFDAYIPGATAVGITYKDGVMMAAERRITLANYVLSKSGKKVFVVTDGVGAVCAGMISDMQNLVREVGVYAKLKELEAKLRGEFDSLPSVGLPPVPYEVETPVGINAIRREE